MVHLPLAILSLALALALALPVPGGTKGTVSAEDGDANCSDQKSKYDHSCADKRDTERNDEVVFTSWFHCGEAGAVSGEETGGGCLHKGVLDGAVSFCLFKEGDFGEIDPGGVGWESEVDVHLVLDAAVGNADLQEGVAGSELRFEAAYHTGCCRSHVNLLCGDAPLGAVEHHQLHTHTAAIQIPEQYGSSRVVPAQWQELIGPRVSVQPDKF